MVDLLGDRTASLAERVLRELLAPHHRPALARIEARGGGVGAWSDAAGSAAVTFLCLSMAIAAPATELARFLDHVADDRLYGLWRLAATTGARRGELAGLTWRALDLDGARLSVEQQLIPANGGVSFGSPKSARSRRTIALDAETVEALRRHREAQLLERDLAGPAYDDRDLVFCDELGGPIHPSRLTKWFARHREAAGIPSGTLHKLRHTAATLALTAGVPVHIVAPRLGGTPTTVLSTYAHLLPQSDEIAAERVAAALVG